MGLEIFRPSHYFGHESEQKIAIIGAASSLGQRKRGVEQFPNFLRRAGLLNALIAGGWQTYDVGNVEVAANETTDALNPVTRGLLYRDHGLRLFDSCRTELLRNRRVLCLGGDHSVAAATVFASKTVFPELKLIWLDAHGDINCPASSPSGNLHGMPLAALLGIFDLSSYPEFSWIRTVLRPQDVFLVGVRDLDPAEKETIQRLSIPILTSREVQKMGPQRAYDEIKKTLKLNRYSKIHLSIDIDGFDPHEAPSTGLTVQNGLSLNDGLSLMHAIVSAFRVVAYDLVEINPHIGTPQDLNRTLGGCLKIIEGFGAHLQSEKGFYSYPELGVRGKIRGLANQLLLGS